jgi:CRP-like cAMP-binding protein
MKMLRRLFAPQEEVPMAVLDALLANWKIEKNLQRNDVLIQPGQTESTLYFVVNGTLRIYYPHEGEEICVGFGYANTLICSYPSLLLNAPSEYCIQAIKAAQLIGIAKDDFYSLMETSAALEGSWRKMTEVALMGKIEREKEMLTFSPEERLRRLFERSPHVFQMIPKKYLASYLRMSPETMSRIAL